MDRGGRLKLYHIIYYEDNQVEGRSSASYKLASPLWRGRRRPSEQKWQEARTEAQDITMHFMELLRDKRITGEQLILRRTVGRFALGRVELVSEELRNYETIPNASQ